MTLPTLNIRTRMWIALGILALATSMTGAFAWNSLDRADTRLQLLHTQTLVEVTRSISLSRQASDMAAVAPYLSTFETRYLIEQEDRALAEALDEIVRDWPEPTATGTDTTVGAALTGVVSQMEQAHGTLVASAGDTMLWVDERQRVEAQLRPLEALLYQSSTAPGLSMEDRATWLTLLEMAGELSGAARAENMLGIGEHQRNLQRLDRGLPDFSAGSKLMAVRQALATALGTAPTLFELRRRELNSRLSAENALFRLGAAASRINEVAADFARQSEERLTSQRLQTVSAITFSKAMIVLIAVGSVLIALTSAVYVSNYVTGNIKLVADAMTRLAAGDRTARLRRHVTADDEIGKLFHAFRVFHSNAERLDRSNH